MKMNGARILVLEDEPIIGFALEDILAAEGAHSFLATTLDEAETAVAGQAFDCGILDVNVHGGKSYGVAARLREGGIPFLFATGYGDTAHPPEFADVPTLSKPYSPGQVRQAIDAIA